VDDIQGSIGRLLRLAVLRHEIEQNPITTSVLWYRGPGRLESAIALARSGRLYVGEAEPFASLFRDPPSAA
jgi:hypothetical protein